MSINFTALQPILERTFTLVKITDLEDITHRLEDVARALYAEYIAYQHISDISESLIPIMDEMEDLIITLQKHVNQLKGQNHA